MRLMLILIITAAADQHFSNAEDMPGNTRNPQAVDEVKTGKRAVANAAWWGFDEDDSTDALQSAIKSGAKKVVVPNMGSDWIVRPIQLAGNQELVLEKGVVISAKRGEYREQGDSVFTANDVDHLKIKGDGATIRMHKEDYIVGLVLKDMNWNRWYGQYPKGEWRMALAIRGCNDVTVEGLTLRDSGGDGLYIDGSNRQRFSRDIVVRKVTCENNYRQGFSVISVDGLTVEDCRFNNTWGTPPSAGIDIEPDLPEHQLRRIAVRRCEFNDNYGDGIEVFLAHQTDKSANVSILFEDCKVRSVRGAGIRVSKLFDEGPKGTITFKNCLVENTEAYGIKVQDKSPGTASLSFINCHLKNTARNKNYADIWAPISFRRIDSSRVSQFGGIIFENCTIEDQRDRPAVLLTDLSEVKDITGKIELKNRFDGVRSIEKPKGLQLKIELRSEQK